MGFIITSDYFSNKDKLRAVYKGTNLVKDDANNFFKKDWRRLKRFVGEFYYNLENDGKLEHEITIHITFIYNYEENPIEEQKDILYSPSWDIVKFARVRNHELFCIVNKITCKNKRQYLFGEIAMFIKNDCKSYALEFLTEMIDSRCKEYARVELTADTELKYW
jgi:hypothetical protein